MQSVSFFSTLLGPDLLTYHFHLLFDDHSLHDVCYQFNRPSITWAILQGETEGVLNDCIHTFNPTHRTAPITYYFGTKKNNQVPTCRSS